MILRPTFDRVLLKRVDAARHSPGGLIIPDMAREKSKECEVIAVGPGRTLDNGTVIPTTLVPGCRVAIGKYSGDEVRVDDDDATYLIVREDDVLGVLAEAP